MGTNKYLVTGACGFIGFETAKALMEEGHQVVGLDNMNDYYDVRLKEYRLSKLKEFSNFEFEPLDIENLPELEALFSKHNFTAVLNLAARAGVRYSMENPFVYTTTNSNGSLNLLECMRQTGIKKFVLASTSSLYAGQKTPFLESLPVNTPISPYAASKKAAEVMAYTYSHLYNLDVTVVRYFTVYGPAGRPDMSIFRFVRWIDQGVEVKIYGDGEQSRDFTYVTDIAKGTVLAAKTDVDYQIINLGGGEEAVSLNTVISWIENHLGKKAKIKNYPLHIADMQTTQANIEKAKELLGWSPKVSLEEGIERSVKWYKDNKEFCDSLRL